MKISLFALPGLDESAQALNQLKEAFPDATISVIKASEAMTELYLCPFVQEQGSGGAFYGMSGIEMFIRFRKMGEREPRGEEKKLRGNVRRVNKVGLERSLA